MIKLLIVDDSLFFRGAIRSIIGSIDEIAVVGEASNGKEAVEMARTLDVDVITMDVEMPVMDGLEATSIIMEMTPKPVIMVSNYTQKESQATLKALEMGAVDFVSKKSSLSKFGILGLNNELAGKIMLWGRHPVTFMKHKMDFSTRSIQAKKVREEIASMISSQEEPDPPTSKKKVDLIVAGASTGGPVIMAEFIARAAKSRLPMVIAQHMPSKFTATFAERLSSKTGLEVMEGRNGMALSGPVVAIAPGGENVVVIRDSSRTLRLRVKDGEGTDFTPSVDMLFSSAAINASNPVGVIMTGMGDDGTKGALELVNKGRRVFAQDPATCMVDGMPQAAIKAGAATDVLNLEEIGEALGKINKPG